MCRPQGYLKFRVISGLRSKSTYYGLGICAQGYFRFRVRV